MAWFHLTSLAFGYTQAGNDKNRAATVPAPATLARMLDNENPAYLVLRVKKASRFKSLHGDLQTSDNRSGYQGGH